MTIRSAAPFLIAAVLLSSMEPYPATAREESLVWSETTNGSLVTLSYGPLDPAKGPVFMLACLNGMNIAVLNVRMALADAEPGDPLTIELTAGRLTTPVKAEATHDQASDQLLGEASDVDVKRVLDVLRLPGPLTVKIGESRETLADRGREDAVVRFVDHCQLI
ncbi:MAG: hypothetical protein ACREDO_05105 [Methyloceanibacter sp.]